VIRKLATAAVLVAVGCLIVIAAGESDSVGSYLGQTAPGLDPVRFAPGLLRSFTFGGTFTPDLEEFYCTAQSVRGQGSQILEMALTDGEWKNLGIPSFAVQADSLEPHVCPSGDRVFFTAAGPSGVWKGYYADRTEGGWDSPKPLPEPINDPRYMPMYFTSSLDGTLYWTQLANGRSYIVCDERTEDGYGPIQRVPFDLNATGTCAHPLIAPDESYLIFDTFRGGQEDSSDLWICFKESEGAWSAARALDALNTDGEEIAASLSPNGSVLFFTREAHIYWVDAHILDAYRP
jgi:hypothetical protein